MDRVVKDQSHKMTSTGRGGAGNFRPKEESPAPETFVTPTIKEDSYTTGRGGAGNFQKNIDPETTRDAQDVGPAYRSHEGGQAHFGRGGAANTVSLGGEDKAADAQVRAASKERHAEGGQHHHESGGQHEGGIHGMVEKGKDLLHGKTHKDGNASAGS